MMSKNFNTQDISEYLDSYYDKFDESFPLMQSNGDSEKIIEQINKCVKQGKKASIMWPQIYGVCEGRNI